VDCGAATYLYDLDPYFYTARYLRAWMLEAMLRRHIEETFSSEWFRTTEAGDFLKSLWSHGQSRTPEELCADLGFGELDAGVLKAGLLGALS
jgi:hypothetical protein